MQGKYDLPNEERRSKLNSMLSELHKVKDGMNIDTEDAPSEVANRVETAEQEIDYAIEAVEEELHGIAEWDAQLVRDLTIDHADRDDAHIRTVDSDIVIEFEVGPYGDETEFRYEVAVTGGNEWFFVKREGDWEEVWSSSR